MTSLFHKYLYFLFFFLFYLDSRRELNSFEMDSFWEFSSLKRGILSSSRVSTTVYLHYLNTNETLGEKSLMVTTQRCCELFWTNPVNSTLQKTPVRSLTSHLTNHPSKTSKIYRVKKTYIHRLFAGTGYRLEDLPIDTDGERETNQPVLSEHLDDVDHHHHHYNVLFNSYLEIFKNMSTFRLATEQQLFFRIFAR